jgi:allophanate hydrolase subunit 1
MAVKVRYDNAPSTDPNDLSSLIATSADDVEEEERRYLFSSTVELPLVFVETAAVDAIEALNHKTKTAS